MSLNHTSGISPEWIIPLGWVGGFEESNPHFPYPHPDLSSLEMLDNMDNIKKLDRQQKVFWPEFSWETEPGNISSRCFQMFSPDISRIGYTDTGRVYSIICPQQGIWIPTVGCLNIEVSVLKQRGWVNETTNQLAADMICGAKIWFSPSTYDKPVFQKLLTLFNLLNLPFPLNKANAIKINLLNSENHHLSILQVRDGETTTFTSPGFAIHKDAWSVKNVEVEIGPIQTTNHSLVDDFNELVMELFNLASGNLLQLGNVLTWNVWVAAPELVDRQEWQNHAEKWRESIDADHGSPTGPGTVPRYFDGSDYYPSEQIVAEIEEKVKALIHWIESHL